MNEIKVAFSWKVQVHINLLKSQKCTLILADMIFLLYF